MGPVTFSQTPVVLVPGAITTGTYTIPWIMGFEGKGINFNVVVNSNYQDIATTTTFTWTSAAVTFTIV